MQEPDRRSIDRTSTAICYIMFAAIAGAVLVVVTVLAGLGVLLTDAIRSVWR